MTHHISTIPITLRNGSVRPVKREYWRLVMPGEVIEKGDEVLFPKGRLLRLPEAVWMARLAWGEPLDPNFHAPHRRRVKVGKS